MSVWVEFEGRLAKKKRDLVADVIAYGQSVLFPHHHGVWINIATIRKQGLCGDCMWEDDQDFEIRLNSSLSLNDLVTTVLHELVHVKQYLNGCNLDCDSPYEERWQEIEAHGMEKELTEGYYGQA